MKAKKAILLLNGQPFEGAIDAENAVVWCCDGAYNWACGRVRIDKNVGDFDSCEGLPYPPPETIYPTEKDCTDGEIALAEILRSGAESIVVYGGDGGREDHFLGNLHLLYRAAKIGVPCEMVTDRSRICMGTGKVAITAQPGVTVSVLPFGGDVHIMGSAGMKDEYPAVLAYGTCRGISNVVTGADAFVQTGDGEYVLVIYNGGSV